MIHQTEHQFFVHGNYEADKSLDGQDPYALLWDSLKRRRPGPHLSRKISIVGHSKQKWGEVLDLGYLKCIITYCNGDGWLTALDIESGQFWQVGKTGKIRRKR